jgi:FdrA protein
MIIKGLVKKGEYFDSVSLMIVSKEINKIEGILDSSVVMGTSENKAILATAGLLLPEFSICDDTDLLISIKSETETYANLAIQEVDVLLKNIRNKKDDDNVTTARSLENAVKYLPGANLALISIAGKYAASEAMKALKNGLHVMIFSDNVSIEDELKLKNFAKEKGLLVMGPDCGTAIINGIPLAFANVVNKGNIGIVAASGTGLQEVSSIISNFGGGISQALGTGGRDVKKEIGGIMFLEALKALNEDDQTKVIVLVSKPPHPEVLQKISEELKNISKPVVGILIGGDPEVLRSVGAIAASNLEEAALIAIGLSQGKTADSITKKESISKSDIQKLASEIAPKTKGKYLRGLFSGGTLCDEAQLILKESIGFLYSNSPLNPDYRLTDLWKSKENTIIDMGEDEFTSGRPHPMIDFSLRCKRIVDEASDKDTAIVLLDVVLGYGSNMQPSEELELAIRKAKAVSPDLQFICSVTGTDMDPQGRKKVIKHLESLGVIVMPSNVAAAQLTSAILQQIS